MFKTYRGIWTLLAVAFALFFAYSMLGPVCIAGVEVKASTMADDFKVKKAKSASSISAKPVTVRKLTPSKKAAAVVPVDTCNKTILFIGDSMLDGLSPRLAAYATTNNHTLYSVIWYSSTSEIWGRSQRLSQYIKRLHPDYVFICLGSNELIVRDIKTKRQKFVDNIVAELSDIPFVWIGPPNWRPDTGINEMIEQSVPAGCYFKSNGMTFERSRDGAHPTPASASLWMDSVARWMPRHAAHPIKMKTPPEGCKSRAKRTFVHQPNER